MPVMSTITRFLLSLRLPMILFSLPYALLWARFDGSAAAVMVLAHTALLLFYCTRFDGHVLAEGQDPRLDLTRDPDSRLRLIVQRGEVLSGAIAVLATLVLLVVNWRLAVLAGAAFALIALTTRGVLGRNSKRRFVAAAIVWPAVLLIAPAFFIGAQGWQGTAETTGPTETVALIDVAMQGDTEAGEPLTDEPADAPSETDAIVEVAAEAQPMTMPVVRATLLGSLMLAAFVILCLVRDESSDRSLGLRTIATTFGRFTAGTAVITCLAAATGLACWGASVGDWHWAVPMVGAWSAMGVGMLMALRMDDHTVGILWLGHAVMACTLVATTA